MVLGLCNFFLASGFMGELRVLCTFEILGIVYLMSTPVVPCVPSSVLPIKLSYLMIVVVLLPSSLLIIFL